MKPPTVCLVAEDRPAHRLVGIDGRLEVVENDVVRRIARLPDFLQHDLPLALQLALLEGRRGSGCRRGCRRQRHIGLQHAGMKGRLLAARIGVQEAAHCLDLFGDVACAPALGALEGHVLEHVGDAHDGRRSRGARRNSTHTPMAALSSCGMGSVTTVKPLDNLVISTFMTGEAWPR